MTATTRTRLANAVRLALVASILPLTAFVGWLAATEPKIMMLLAVALPVWICADFEVPGFARTPAPRGPLAEGLPRGMKRARPAADLSAVASWS